jgi:NAD(P)-dependent dehydrogenase (short-subunit alcohol dehydrogenase family)
MSSTPIALVTGASSGIGRAIATRLAGAGYTVFGTSRRPAESAPLPGVTLVPLDVTDDASVAACVRSVVDAAGRIDLLVNNAGMAVMGAVEEVSLDQARRQFETNFFGVLRMTQAVLPVLRRQRSGCIINIGSVAGLVPIPFGGLYSASKSALAGVTDALRTEVAALGIRVALVEPGFFKTELVAGATSGGKGIDDYRPVRERVIARFRAIEAAAEPPTAVAELVLRLANDPAPPLRNPVGKEKIFATLRRFLPQAMFEPQGRKYWRATG